MESCSEPSNTIQQKIVVKDAMSVAWSTSKNSKSSKCSPQEFWVGANDWKWGMLTRHLLLLRRTWITFAREWEKDELDFTMHWALGFPEEEKKGGVGSHPCSQNCLMDFIQKCLNVKCRNSREQWADLFPPEQSCFCQVWFWLFLGTSAWLEIWEIGL